MRYCALALLTLAVSEAVRHQVLSMSGEDVILRCEALSKPDVQYRSVIWYKVTEEPKMPSRQLSGLIIKRLTKNNTVSKYNGVTRHMELLENSTDLFLPNVTAEDDGIYSCFLSAPLGHQNQEGEVHLKVYAEKTVFNNSDTIYIVALTVLVMALIIMFISYVCLKNIFQNIKKPSKDSLWKMPHQTKQLMVTLQSKNLVFKTLPEVCV